MHIIRGPSKKSIVIAVEVAAIEEFIPSSAQERRPQRVASIVPPSFEHAILSNTTQS